MERCVNIDWLEVYCLEDAAAFPLNADYFRAKGYFVKEREYGTRVYKEMFTIEDKDGQPWIEIRRNPASGESSFSGLKRESCHIRLVNAKCYETNCVAKLRDFLLLHDYLFQSIYRLDIAYDFERFDSGDIPRKVARRIIEKKIVKINQARIAARGQDNWETFDWQTLSWGSPSSMVTTKMYNKSLELATVSKHKTYIPYVWWLRGLIADPVNQTKQSKDGRTYKPEIWRIEFSLHSTLKGFVVIEDTAGKRIKKQRIPNTLSMYDAPDKLWQRFLGLSYHYFRFKIMKSGVRKDRLEDKVLFDYKSQNEFTIIDHVPAAAKQNCEDEIIRKHLQMYRLYHQDPKIVQACNCILEEIDTNRAKRVTVTQTLREADALQRAIALKMGGSEKDASELYFEILKLITEKTIF